MTGLAFSPDDARLAKAAAGRIDMVDTDTGIEISVLHDAGLGIPEVLAYSPDGQQLAIGTQSGNIWLWQGHY